MRPNLTRSPLIFPENRTFFLDDSDIFDFGLGTNDDVRAFFNRRVGLLSQREVPLDAGLKVNGRQGGTRLRRPRRADRSARHAPHRPRNGVMRIRQNVLGESSAGVVASVGDPLGRDRSWMAGADLTYQTSRFRGDKNVIVGAWGLALDREDLTGRRHAIGGKLDYPNDLWDVALTYKYIGDDFDPSLGFVPRPGVQIVNFNVNLPASPDAADPRPQGPADVQRVPEYLRDGPGREVWSELLLTNAQTSTASPPRAARSAPNASGEPAPDDRTKALECR